MTEQPKYEWSDSNGHTMLRGRSNWNYAWVRENALGQWQYDLWLGGTAGRWSEWAGEYATAEEAKAVAMALVRLGETR